MSDDRLAIIAVEAIPDKGGSRFERRLERLRGHALDASLTSFLTAIFTTGSGLMFWLLATNLSRMPWFLICLATAFSSATAVCVHTFGKETWKALRNYLNEKDPQFCLPSDSCPEDAEFELALKEATREYNAAAQEWNAYVATGDMLPNAGKLKSDLLKRRARIEEGIHFLREGGTFKELPEPAQTSPRKMLTSRARIGPSGLIKQTEGLFLLRHVR